MQEGFDVSHHQGTIDWDTVKLAPQSYCFIKATDGMALNGDTTTAVDHEFASNWAGAKAAGLTRGAYHFFRPRRPVADQVAIFSATVGTLDAADLPPALDIEIPDDDPTAWDSFTPTTALATILDCLQQIQAAFGRRPVLYMNRNFYDAVLQATPGGLTAYALWWAQTGTSNPDKVPDDWAIWRFWQYSFNGTVAGVNSPGKTDLDRFNGDNLAQFIQNSMV